MKLYFLRHADALDGDDDCARPLSPHGKTQVREVARFLQRADIGFDAAYASPLARAQQTAGIVLNLCGTVVPEQLQTTGALLNEVTQTKFSQWLGGLPPAKHVLLVGHEPSLAERVRTLLSMKNPDALRLPKGGLVCVDSEDGRDGMLKFSVTPKVLGI